MKRTVWMWQLWGFAFTSLGGTLLHFLYEWLGKPMWIAPFSGVNESTWEHMKLLFFPMLFYAIFESFFFRKRSDFWSIKLKGTLLGLILIPIIFYNYNGIIGKSPDFVNIAIFFVSAATAYAYEHTKLKKGEKSECVSARLSLIILITVAAFFILFTFKTPKLAIFRDPITGTYGI